MTRITQAAASAGGLLLPLLLTAAPALACPDMTVWGDRYKASGTELRDPLVIPLTAGGDVALEDCDIPFHNPPATVIGKVMTGPDVSLSLTGLRGKRLAFSTQTECDSVLVLNTGSRNWYYDDDDNQSSGLAAQIVLTRPAGDGVYDLWVGSADGESCEGKLIVQTY